MLNVPGSVPPPPPPSSLAPRPLPDFVLQPCNIKLAQKQGIVAAYLNITAIFFALVIVAVNAAVWCYGHTSYTRMSC